MTGQAPFAFVSRQPKGIPTGGQFAASARGESEVSLSGGDQDYWQTLEALGPLDVGEWAEGEGARVRLVEYSVDSPDDGAGNGEPTLVLDVQVRADHPDAGETDPEAPEWATPRSGADRRPQVPRGYAATGQGRRDYSAFALRQFDNLMGDLGALWGELGEAVEMSSPQLR